MKINDIIMENTNNLDQWQQQAKDKFFRADGSPKPLAQKLGTSNWQTIGNQAKSMDPTGRDIDGTIDNIIDNMAAKKQQPPKSQQTAKPQPTQQQPTDRTRKDVKGRNLKHDRYYQPKKDTPDPTPSGDNMFDQPLLPKSVRKAVNKVKKVGSDASAKFKQGSALGKKLTNL